ncbi:MAG: sigma-70 family RNA polymerase sigma factor [Planctomycetota bacterium]|nr:MAG: sigma-70 family RNA polymerase sigma factor [Planctomycetota bacterium]
MIERVRFFLLSPLSPFCLAKGKPVFPFLAYAHTQQNSSVPVAEIGQAREGLAMGGVKAFHHKGVSVPLESDQSGDYTREGLLLSAYVKGEDPDGRALEALVGEYQEPAFWLAYQLLSDDDLARDIVQDAFVKLFRKPENYDPQRPFKAWFLRVVRNLSIDRLRRQRCLTLPEVVDGFVDEAKSDPLEAGERVQRVRHVLALLPEKYRALLIMRDVEGCEPQDMAEAEGIEPGAMRFRIHYARKAFRKLWRDTFGEEVPDEA